jgi:O-antigen/teichoic acid export membrane protein
MAFGAPATLALAASVLFKASDKAVIGKLFSIEFLGFYSMAFFLTDLPMAKVNAILRPVFLPYFARLRATPDRMRAHFCKFVLVVSSLVFPVLAGLAVVAPLAVGVVLGDKWLQLIGPLQVLCAVGLIRAFVDNVPHLLLALGKPVQVLWIRLFYLIVLPTSFVALGLAWGVTGIYVTWLVVFPVISSAMLYMLRRVAGIRQWDYARNLLAPTVSTCFMALCTFLAMGLLSEALPPAIALPVVVVVGGVSYVAFYWVVFRSEATEILRVARGQAA